ncbi:hypothetical protein ABTA80_19740, partial [Acinetobacter baumannii]
LPIQFTLSRQLDHELNLHARGLVTDAYRLPPTPLDLMPEHRSPGVGPAHLTLRRAWLDWNG